MLALIFTAAQKKGEIRADLPVEYLSGLLVGSIVQIALHWTLHGKARTTAGMVRPRLEVALGRSAAAMSAFLGWREACKAGAAVCGGKGYNLARLARYGFRVPRGGVLAAGAPLAEIRPGLEQLGLLDAKLAVRSSATAEDSARASFAGIHRSFLNVSGVEAVKLAAQGCIDSLQTPEAIAYRRRMGFRDEEVQCAVVICEMVEARCAGVAFSCDPATGRRDLILIDAAEGLGEAVVSGRVNPQRILWRNQGGRFSRQGGEGRLATLPERY